MESLHILEFSSAENNNSKPDNFLSGFVIFIRKVINYVKTEQMYKG